MHPKSEKNSEEQEHIMQDNAFDQLSLLVEKGPASIQSHHYEMNELQESSNKENEGEEMSARLPTSNHKCYNISYLNSAQLK